MGNVLIVEDNGSLNRLYAKALTHAGYTVIQAVNCQQAINCLQIMPPDLVLLDVSLPDGNGISVVGSYIQENARLQKTRIIVMSAERDYSSEVKAAGISRFIPKPIPINLLSETVRHELESATLN